MKLNEYINAKESLEYFKRNNIINDNWLNERFNKINEESLIDLYVTIGDPKYDIFQEYLYERLENSINVDINFIEKLTKNIIGIDSIIVINDYKLTIKHNSKFSIKNKMFVSLCNFFNYYIISNENNTLNLEAKKPQNCTALSFPYVIHITSKENYEKIKQNGLVPKFSSKLSNLKYLNDDYERPKHIYCFQHTISNTDLIQYSRLLGINNPVFLKIDTTQFKIDHKNTALRFYGDPSTIGYPAIFTEEPIKTKYIKEYELNSPGN